MASDARSTSASRHAAVRNVSAGAWRPARAQRRPGDQCRVSTAAGRACSGRPRRKAAPRPARRGGEKSHACDQPATCSAGVASRIDAEAMGPRPAPSVPTIAPDAVGRRSRRAPGRGADRHVGRIIHVERTRNVEKSNATPWTIIESTNIQHTPPPGLPSPEQTEAQHPGEHGRREHDALDAEALQEEGISRIQSVSDTCDDSEMSALAWTVWRRTWQRIPEYRGTR